MIIKPLGHNPHVREFGQIAPIDPPQPHILRHSDLVQAIVISAGLHILIVFLFWLCGRGSPPGDRDSCRVIDTRVKERELLVDICLELIDDAPIQSQKLRAINGPKFVNSALAETNRSGKGSAKPLSGDSSRKGASQVAGAESSKPRSTDQASQISVGVSKTPPWPSQTNSDLSPPNGQSPKFSSETHHALGSSLGGIGRDSTTENRAVTFFHIEARAKTVVYVIDRSVSMGPNGKLARAKGELLRSVEHLPADARFQIILFNRLFQALLIDHSTELQPATVENKRRVEEFLETILPEGGTQPLAALKRALAMKPEVIYFLSDSEDLNERDVRELTFVNRGHAAIHVLAIEDGQEGGSCLHMLAKNNRGECRGVSESTSRVRSVSGN